MFLKSKGYRARGKGSRDFPPPVPPPKGDRFDRLSDPKKQDVTKVIISPSGNR